MPIRGAEYAVSRVIATLQAYLPAELDLLDSIWNDGLNLEDVETENYYEVEMVDREGYIPEYPAIVVSVLATTPLEIKSTTNSPGVYHATHDLTAQVSVKDDANEDPKFTWRRISRYAVSIERVLAIKYPTLPSAGVETVVSVIREGDVTYAREAESIGEFIRTATIPFAVTVYENL